VEKPSTKSIGEDGRIHFYDHEFKGAETAAKRGEAFNLSNDEIGRIHRIVLHHMRFHFFSGRMEGQEREPSRRAIYRFFRDAGEAGVDLVLLGLADLRGTYGATLPQATWTASLDVARILLENYWEKHEETVAPPRILDGNDLMRELALKPGPTIGQLLEAIREGQATGKITTREEALEFAKQQLKELEKQ
jgi:tRNA nucleotidyltransferase/poly(A) polymerase